MLTHEMGHPGPIEKRSQRYFQDSYLTKNGMLFNPDNAFMTV